MAKQVGIHQIKGKVGGMSYYGMKGVTGNLVKSINSGLSNRVKTSDAYANTRLNASEFGYAGSFSGALVRTISKRWRTILNSFSTGMLQKMVVSIVRTDSTHAWGQRELAGSDYQPVLRQKLNELVKLNFLENVTRGLIAQFTTPVAGVTTYTITPNILTTDGANLKSRGADGIIYEVFLQRTTAGEYNSAAAAYGAALGEVEFLGTFDNPIGTAYSTAVTHQATEFVNADNVMSSIVVVAMPYKTIGSQKNILQEMCTCIFMDANEVSE